MVYRPIIKVQVAWKVAQGGALRNDSVIHFVVKPANPGCQLKERKSSIGFRFVPGHFNVAYASDVGGSLVKALTEAGGELFDRPRIVVQCRLQKAWNGQQERASRLH